ncbi:MAG TPA: ATP-binding protein, partial [Ideonella sp.]|nr:ATP-binding protein [Ideonella sp.]
ATLLQGWVALKLAVAAVRVGQGRVFRQTEAGRPPAPAGLHRSVPPGCAPGWHRATLTLLALDGAVWGVAGVWLVSGPETTASLVAAVLACIACVATFGLQVSLRATASYVLPMLVPTALALVARGDRFGAFGGIGLLLLTALQMVTASRAERRLADGILLRLRAQELAGEKEAALRLALRQSAVKSQFLGNVSHELRTPLHGILGLARLLHLDSDEPVSRQRIELIESSGRHLLALINDLLDISRIEMGRFTLRDEPFELLTQLEQVTAVHALRAEDRGLHFELLLSAALRRDCPCWVHGDPARFRQVLHNLLGNAIKFTERGAIVVRVGRADERDRERYSIEVEDSGPGIAHEAQAQIFEAFEQTDVGSAGIFEGAGLGLKIARELAIAMGGGLSVRSQPGVGSCFTFTLRLPAAAAVAPPVAEQEPAPPQRRPLKVLLAEDEDVNALIASAYLDRLGVNFERVEDGKEAVRRALREVGRPDLILMDCRMPLMDGYAATRAIRAQEDTLGLARVPVIALTATVTELGRTQCIEAGMDDFLSKPFTLEELDAALQRHDVLQQPSGALR